MKKHIISKEDCGFTQDITIASSTYGDKRLYLTVDVRNPSDFAYTVAANGGGKQFFSLDEAIDAYNEI